MIARGGAAVLAAAGLAAAGLACGGGGGGGAAPATPPTAASAIATAGCACTTLGCLGAQQDQLARLRAGSHLDGAAAADAAAANERLNACAATLAAGLGSDIESLADAICACPDRACQDALKPRVDAVFDIAKNGATLAPATVAELKLEADRFVTCAARFEPPPAAGSGSAAAAWAITQVPECGYSVELPGAVRRVENHPPEAPDVLEVDYFADASRSALFAACVVFPAAMALPDSEQVLRGMASRAKANAEGIGGGIVKFDVEIEEPTRTAATYHLAFGNGKVISARLVLAGRQLREVSGIVDPSGDFDRLVASFLRSSRASPDRVE